MSPIGPKSQNFGPEFPPVEPNRRCWGVRNRPNLGPSAKYLVGIYSKFVIWSILVVAHTCRVIDITSPPRISKIAQIATPGSHNRRPWRPSTIPNLGPSAKYLAWAWTKEKIWFQTGSCLYLVRTIYHQPAQKLKNRPDRDPRGGTIPSPENQVLVRTSVQALETFFAYTQRWRYENIPVVGFTW
jgi:hypothetical protein